MALPTSVYVCTYLIINRAQEIYGCSLMIASEGGSGIFIWWGLVHMPVL